MGEGLVRPEDRVKAESGPKEGGLWVTHFPRLLWLVLGGELGSRYGNS